VIKRGEPVEVLDLAPRRKRPLSIWNPLDYLVLIYWIFFFPQALGWYVKTFCPPGYQWVKGANSIWLVLLRDRVQSSLVIMGFILILVWSVFILGVLRALGLPAYGQALSFGVGFAVITGIFFGVTAGPVKNTARVLVNGVTLGISFGVFAGVLSSLGLSVAGVRSLAIAVVSGFCCGLIFSLYFGASIESRLDIGWRIIKANIVGIPAGLGLGIIAAVRAEAVVGLVLGISFIVSFELGAARVFDWLISAPFWVYKGWLLSRLVWLPLPRVKRRLELSLERDWSLGVGHVNRLLVNSLQFMPSFEATESVLARASREDLLLLVKELPVAPAGPGLLYFSSACLRNTMWARVVKGIPFLPKGWKVKWNARFPAELRLNTLAQCACAGFYLWHEKDAAGATNAFSRVREIRFGEEVYRIARAIATGEQCKDLASVAAWEGETANLEELPAEQLRPEVLATLGILRRISAEASVAAHALAPLNRSAALNRGLGELRNLLATGGSSCPQPEWALLQRIAQTWLDILLEAAGEEGHAILNEPIRNPYEGYSGLPVTGSIFVGRRAKMRTIETRWATGDVLPVVILYGHRRMGKTSILRNLEPAAGPKTLLVYLDMQDIGWIDHTGQLLLDLAEAVHKRTSKAGLDPGPQPLPERYANLGEARRELNSLLDHLDPQMTGCRLILAIDEFELVEEGLAKGRIDPGFLPYLRAIHQRYRWLALIFGGLHTLDELGRDYQSAFYGQAEHIRVGYLTHDDAIQLITQPHQDFALEYSPALREELFRLTYGQPFLIQRLCWELVNRWNERFLAAGEATPRTLEMDDLAPVLTDDLYAGAAYYFDGVWSNVTEAERRIMEVMASRENVWGREELAAASGEEDLETALGLLRRHDVIVEQEGKGLRFASELMRRWVARQMQTDIESM
jgi:hypothetical protein